MKIRTGFISNSSSSSFVIAFDGNKKELESKLKKIFELPIPNNYPIKMPSFHKCFMDNISDNNSWKEYIKQFTDDENDLSEIDEIIKGYFEKGWRIYWGDFCDDEGDEETFLCRSDIKYEDNEIYIYKEADY